MTGVWQLAHGELHHVLRNGQAAPRQPTSWLSRIAGLAARLGMAADEMRDVYSATLPRYADQPLPGWK